MRSWQLKKQKKNEKKNRKLEMTYLQYKRVKTGTNVKISAGK